MIKKKQNLIKNIFIDRIEELKLLTVGLMGGGDFVLIAPRRFGKTTLVNKAFDEIRKNDNYILMSIDIMRYSGSIRKLAEGITEQCLQALGYKGKLQLLLKQINLSLQLKMSFGELEIEPMLKLFRDKSDDLVLLEHALELFEKIALKENKTVIIFFDEFSELHALGLEVIKIFRSVLQLQKNACCIFAGSQETLMAEIFVAKTAAFFRFGDIMKLSYLNKEEVIKFLNASNFSFNIAENILNFFECHPYYTSKVIQDLILEPEYALSNVDFFRYLQDRLLMQESAYLEMIVHDVKAKANALEILTNIALGVEINSGLEHKSRQSLYRTVKDFEKSGYLIKVMDKYKLIDPLLKLYLSQ